MIDWLDLGYRKHTAHVLLEVDVTQVRQEIREYRARTGDHLSLTAFVTSCFARAIGENQLMHACRKGRTRLVLFGEVDVAMPIEREVEGQHIPVPLIIRSANMNSAGEIDREIRSAKSGGNPQTRGMRWLPLWLLLPGFIRRFVWKTLLGNPYRRKRIIGTTLVTNAGMFGTGTAWGISSPGVYTTCLVVSIARKPEVIGDRTDAREYLCLTISVDHDIVDGGVVARFAQRLKQLIEDGSGLREESPKLDDFAMLPMPAAG